jgi:hypothetical protein
MRLASLIPRSPVQAFEFPELMTTARAVADGTRSRETMTGAPTTQFRVNTPAAAAGRVETNRARSDFPDSLIPQVTPAV